jgi:hypothetical protein
MNVQYCKIITLLLLYLSLSPNNVEICYIKQQLQANYVKMKYSPNNFWNGPKYLVQ